MRHVDDDPVGWFVDFVIGLIKLNAIQLLTGCWAALLIRTNLQTPTKLAICLPVIALLAYLSCLIFDPTSHFIGAILGGVSMVFTTPLQVSAWIHIKSKPEATTSLFEVVMRIAVPAAIPSKRYPAEKTRTQFVRGVIYLSIAGFCKDRFRQAVDEGGLQMDVLAAVFVTCGATGALNLTSAFLGCLGVRSPSPFRRPWLSRTLAEFWAGRWNAPISDALRLGVYNPLRKAYGCSQGVAVLTCFFISGIAHELILLYCGITSSRGEWFSFFMLSGILTILEKNMRPVLPGGAPGHVLMLVVFYIPFHYLFIPVTVRTGMAHVGVQALSVGPVLIKHLLASLA